MNSNIKIYKQSNINGHKDQQKNCTHNSCAWSESVNADRPCLASVCSFSFIFIVIIICLVLFFSFFFFFYFFQYHAEYPFFQYFSRMILFDYCRPFTSDSLIIASLLPQYASSSSLSFFIFCVYL